MRAYVLFLCVLLLASCRGAEGINLDEILRFVPRGRRYESLLLCDLQRLKRANVFAQSVMSDGGAKGPVAILAFGSSFRPGPRALGQFDGAIVFDFGVDGLSAEAIASEATETLEDGVKYFRGAQPEGAWQAAEWSALVDERYVVTTWDRKTLDKVVRQRGGAPSIQMPDARLPSLDAEAAATVFRRFDPESPLDILQPWGDDGLQVEAFSFRVDGHGSSSKGMVELWTMKPVGAIEWLAKVGLGPLALQDGISGSMRMEWVANRLRIDGGLASRVRQVSPVSYLLRLFGCHIGM